MDISEIQRVRKVNRIKNFTLALVKVIGGRLQSIIPASKAPRRETPSKDNKMDAIREALMKETVEYMSHQKLMSLICTSLSSDNDYNTVARWKAHFSADMEKFWSRLVVTKQKSNPELVKEFSSVFKREFLFINEQDELDIKLDLDDNIQFENNELYYLFNIMKVIDLDKADSDTVKTLATLETLKILEGV